MRRRARFLWSILSSRSLSPLVIGAFLLVYVGIGYFTDDALIALMGLTRSNPLLLALLALLPINSACRLIAEAHAFRTRRQALAGRPCEGCAGLFDEAVTLPGDGGLAEVQERLARRGYAVRPSAASLAVMRGIPVFPLRAMYLAATCCLFAGILISLSTRTAARGALVEGAPFSMTGGSGVIERIVLGDFTGHPLFRGLAIVAAPADAPHSRLTFGLYPPTRFRGEFVYPRYLGINLHLRFSAPDLSGVYEDDIPANLYPPGKEERIGIPGSSYRFFFSLLAPDDGTDPYVTGRMTFAYRLLNGAQPVASGVISRGGQAEAAGCRLELSDARRMVVTDFIGDNGVFLIWTAGVLYTVALLLWLPLRLFLPRREMLFCRADGALSAFSRAEGRRRAHARVFHEILDVIEARRASPPVP
jgi:hypothetical protein